MESTSVTIQIKTTEQYFPVVLFVMLYKVVITDSGLWTLDMTLDKTHKCDYLNQNYPAVLDCGALYHAVQGGTNF